MHCNTKLTHPHARLPQRSPTDPWAVGYDLYSPDDCTIDPLSRKLVKLGIRTEFTRGYAGLIRDRSGMGSKGITVLAGVIDPEYRGEWGVVLYNTTCEVFRISRGDRIAQVLFIPVGSPEILAVDGELPETQRSEGGFGSSGQ